jgi:hypothetical protein
MVRRRPAAWPTVLAIAVLLLAGVVVAPSAEAATWRAVNTIRGSGLAATIETFGAVPVDYDGDGDQDVWIGFHDQGAALFTNDGTGHYRRLASGAWPTFDPVSGLRVDRHQCAWGDVDLDGRPDAYCAAGRTGHNVVKTGMDNELWLQRSPGVFTDVGTDWGVGDVCGRTQFAAFLDANGDGFPDLYIGNAAPRPVTGDPCDDPANGLTDELSKLFINEGGTGFRYAPELGDWGYGGDRCAEVADIDGDGWPDLLTCGQPRMQLFHNDAGSGFTDVALANGLTDRYNDAVFADLDRDGDPDLVTAGPGEFGYRLNTAGTFGAEQLIGLVPAGGQGWSVTVGDADGDRDLDVYGLITDMPGRTNPGDRLYRNNALRFTAIAVPGARGVGDAVAALRGDRNARREFLVLNGDDTVGPIQRIELVRR